MQDKVVETISLDGSEYRIVQMTPFDACWLWKTAVANALPPAVAQIGDGATVQDLGQVNLLELVPHVLGRISEVDFAGIQKRCLAVCRKVNGAGLGERIYDRNSDRFMFPEIEGNAPLVLNLTMATLKVCLAPFFSANALSGLFQNSPSNQSIPSA